MCNYSIYFNCYIVQLIAPFISGDYSFSSLLPIFCHQFLDGSTEDSPELARYCVREVPLDVHSTGNQLRVEFHTDHSVGGRGFLFSWKADGGTPLVPTTGTSPTPSKYSTVSVIV